MDVAESLHSLGLERYTQAFQDAEVTPQVLPELTEADLRELGLPLGPRKMVLKAIEALGPSAAPGPVDVRLPAGQDETGDTVRGRAEAAHGDVRRSGRLNRARIGTRP